MGRGDYHLYIFAFTSFNYPYKNQQVMVSTLIILLCLIVVCLGFYGSMVSVNFLLNTSWLGFMEGTLIIFWMEWLYMYWCTSIRFRLIPLLRGKLRSTTQRDCSIENRTYVFLLAVTPNISPFLRTMHDSNLCNLGVYLKENGK